jgi:CHAD domain-containing protein
MAYALTRGETIDAAIRRILIEQVDRATAQLGEKKHSAAKRIHDARKRFKEIRAVLRLVRKPLGGTFEIENLWFRDAGRELSAVRDTEALLEAATKLGRFFHARRVLRRRRDDAIGADVEARIANLLEQLPVAKARLANIAPLEDRFATIADGLEETYARGRTAFRRASANPAVEEVHEWRKRVKDHWYHVQLLGNVWPEIMKPYAGVMAELSSALGDRHDLDVLRALVEAEPSRFGSARAVRRLIGAIDRRRETLLVSAISIGSRVYAEDPRSWRTRVRGYWRSWRG